MGNDETVSGPEAVRNISKTNLFDFFRSPSAFLTLLNEEIVEINFMLD